MGYYIVYIHLPDKNGQTFYPIIYVDHEFLNFLDITLCPGSSYQIYIVTYYIKWGNYFLDTWYIGGAMVLVFDGLSEIGAGVRGILWYLICSRHLNRSRAEMNRIFVSFTCA